MDYYSVSLVAGFRNLILFRTRKQMLLLANVTAITACSVIVTLLVHCEHLHFSAVTSNR